VIDARFGVTQSLTGPNGLTTTWSYDGFGRKSDETRADSTTTNIARAWCDGTTCPGVTNAKYKVTKTASGKPPVTVYYDALNRELRKESVGFDGTAVYVDTTYDSLGRVATVSNPYYSGGAQYDTTYVYDAVGRVTQETAPGNRITTKSYAGLSTSVTSARTDLTQTTTRTKDALGRLVEVTDALLNDTHYAYDAVGNLLQVTDAATNTIQISYDLRGRKLTMNDPDMGQWEYAYNSFGQLTYQKDAKGQESWLSYDALGRMSQRIEGEGTTTWTYNDGTAAVGSRGKLQQVTSPGGYLRTHSYDGLGRPTTVATSLDGSTYTHTTGYDTHSRPDSHTYPGGFQVHQAYNAQGYLEKVYDPADPTDPYWQANSANARGQITQETLKNDLITTRTFQATTGYLDQIGTGTSASYWNVQSLSFSFDEVGNLTQRSDDMQSAPGGGSLTEDFGYDALNRLTSATIAGVGSNSYAYDANGSMTSGGGRTLGYTSFNKPNAIAKGATSLTFLYGADRARIKQVRTDTNGTQTTYYVGHYEKIVKTGVTIHRHTITAGGRRIGIYTQRSNGINDTRYLHTDHQDSLNAITDETGTVTERFSFDAFGRVRQTDWTYDPVGNLMSSVTTRGYTGHEQLNDVGLIHMNGRIYDPTLGRFASADPFVQAAANPQSLNRYSYVLNNPLSYTDPSGYFFKKLFRGIKKALRSKLVRAVVGIAALIHGGDLMGWAGKLFKSEAIGKGLVGGALLGYVSTGTLKGTLSGGLSGAMFGWIGDQALATPWKTLAHGAGGGVMSELQGGEFKHGFWGAGIAQAISPMYKGMDPVAQGIVRATVGGTMSRLSGGKFANGAVASAYGYLFNELSHTRAAKLYIERLRAGSPLAREILDAMATDPNTKYHIDVGSLPDSTGGGLTRTQQPSLSLWDRLMGKSSPIAVIMSVDASPSVHFVDVNGSSFLPSTVRLLAHELGYGYTFLKGGYVGSRINYDAAVHYENEISQQLNPSAPVRAISDHGGWH